MDFSLFYFANDSTASGTAGRYELLTEGARFADRNGFTAVWTPERHFHPFGGLYPNPAVTGAALATVTERIAIRAGSVVAPLGHPLRIAEDWSVVDNLSHGRAGVSFASGWHPTDFVLRPEAHARRKELLTETVETVRALWRGESVTLPDGRGADAEVRVYPPAVQGELPCWITSAGSADTFRTAGELNAGVLTHLLGQDLDELAGKLAVYRAALREHHGEQARGHVVLMLHTFLGTDTEEVRELVRPSLSAYLKTSFGLLSGTVNADAAVFDRSAVREADVDYLVERAFQRFFDRQGIFGTVERALGVVERLEALGIDEVGCLVDFGVDTERTLKSLEHLNDLRIRAAGQCMGAV
ncbi:MupA/Atu3671 family FMN-dependent luciferase-like monooxygenase [Streptomyces sp. NPDC086023]|uniref:MupA/Atu3671 family FMN-dependent luciferase-like monooxygenase n=1 Tax=Streptomyces sp. NPDC086023 TaxID=3365746 RepID=UPI0037D2787D